MTIVTRILSQIESGDPIAAKELLPLVYAELRRLAEALTKHLLVSRKAWVKGSVIWMTSLVTRLRIL